MSKLKKFKSFILNKKKNVINKNGKRNIFCYDGGYLNLSQTSTLTLNGYYGLCCDNPNKYQAGITLKGNATMTVDGKFKQYFNSNIFVERNATLSIGEDCFINSGTTINCYNEIKIGNRVCIANNVSIRDSDFHHLDYKGYEISKPIEIGDDVWICDDVTILKGVKIGSGSVIGAKSLVNRDVPENCLVAGNPAKVIKTDIKWH